MAYGQIASALTGTIAATTSGSLYAILNPAQPIGEVEPAPLEIRRLHVQWTTIVAFGTLVTASRGLKLLLAKPNVVRPAHPTGGADFSFVHKRPGDDELIAHGFVATTGALTLADYTLQPNVRARMSLVHVGAAGATVDAVWRWDNVEADALWLPAGWLAVVATEQALDATGTGQLQIDADVRTARV